MALSELQKIIVGGLKICGVRAGEIVLAGVMLKTEKQQWEMADYLETVIDNPPSSEVIMQKVQAIAAK